MTELRQPSRAEISGGVSETQHIAADIVTVHGGVASEIHIVNPSEVTIYGGTLNNFFIYSDNPGAVNVIQNAGVMNTFNYKKMADYKAASTGENSGKTRTTAVGAGQVSVGGTVGGGVFAETTRTIERGTDFVGGRVIKGDLVKGRIIEGDLITGAVGNIFTGAAEQSTSKKLPEYVVSAEEAVRLGISPGTYYLDADMYTSPRRVGNDTYIMVTSHIKTQGEQITVGFGRGNPVLIQGKFLYEKS